MELRCQDWRVESDLSATAAFMVFVGYRLSEGTALCLLWCKKRDKEWKRVKEGEGRVRKG